MSWPFRRAREVVLAVDDGPSTASAALLDGLEAAGHRAVLFVVGGNLAGREAWAADALRRGFALGNHSYTHPRFSGLTLGEARAEIVRTEAALDAVHAAAGVARRARWFRFPYLDTGGANAAVFQRLLAELGFARPRAVAGRRRRDWPTTLDSRDWQLPGAAALRATLGRARPGDLIELHDKPDTVPATLGVLVETLAALSLRAVVPGRAR